MTQFGWALNYSVLSSGAQSLGTDLRSCAKDMTNTIVIINSQTENGPVSVDDVLPGRDGPENLRILKKSQLKVDIGLCWQRIEFLRLKDVINFCRSLPTEILNMTICTARVGG